MTIEPKEEGTEAYETYGPSLERLELLEELTVGSVREFSRANYDRGGDIIEECLSDKEIEEMIWKGRGEVLLFLKLQYSKRMDIESPIW